MAKENEQRASSYESIVRQASRSGTQVYKFSKIYPAFIVLAVMLVLSIIVYKVTDNKIRSDRQNEFDKAAISVVNRVGTGVQRNSEVLNSMSGLYDLLIQVVRDYFELYGTVPAKTYPSIMSISYCPKVVLRDSSQFIYIANSQGYLGLLNYRLHPKTIHSNVIYPVLHTVPFQKNISQLGFILNSEPLISSAIEFARDSNEFSSTTVFPVRGDTSGFYMIAPVYKKDSPRQDVEERQKNFMGVVALEINAKTFFDLSLGYYGRKDGSVPIASDTSVAFKVVQNIDKGEQTIYESRNASAFNSTNGKTISGKYDIQVANRNFGIKFVSAPNLGGSISSFLPTATLAGSLVLSFAFFGFLISVITSRTRAVDLAERITRSQRRIVDTSKDIIAVMDYSGTWKSMNPASLEILGIDSDSMIGGNIAELFNESTEINKFEQMKKQYSVESTERIDFTMKSADGAIKWIAWSFTFSPAEKLIYAIGRDVTLEKLAEEEALLKSKQISLAEQFAREASESKSYFMIKLSHQLRNSLTGIIGYIQLLSYKSYETEEEHDNFLQEALGSSEELYTYVTDIVDATLGTDHLPVSLPEIVRFGTGLELANSNALDPNIKLPQVNFDIPPESMQARMYADKATLAKVLIDSILALTSGEDGCTITVNAQENTYEGATEIQILSDSNPLVSEMIELFKYNSDNLIDALKVDKKDVLLRLASIQSNVRRMNGSMSAESLGSEDGNLIIINMPMNKVQY